MEHEALEMRMLEGLKDILDEIEGENEWEHDFVQGLLIQQEEGRGFSKNKVTNKQFYVLLRIYHKWCG